MDTFSPWFYFSGGWIAGAAFAVLALCAWSAGTVAAELRHQRRSTDERRG